MVGTAAAIIGSALIGAGTSAAGSIIGSKAAKGAAKTQAAAAEEIRAQAQDAAKEATTGFKEATGEANQVLSDAEARRLEALQPLIQAGNTGLTGLQKELGEGGDLSKKFEFDYNRWVNTPEYEFQKQQLDQKANRIAAATGVLNTGGTQKGLLRFSNGLMTENFDAGFQRALQEYQLNRQTTLARIQGFQGLTEVGVNANARQDMVIGSTQGQIAENKLNSGRYAGDVGLRSAEIAAEAIAGRANADAAGQVGSANAWTSGLGNISKAVTAPLVLYSMSKMDQPATVGSPSKTKTQPFNPNLEITKQPLYV